MPKKIGKPKLILVRPRIQVGDVMSIGPGKIDLLRQVAVSSSISAAARVLGIPYKRAWSLLETLNQGFREPLTETIAGGKGGGGTKLTPLGEQLVAHYEILQQQLYSQAQTELKAIQALVDRRQQNN